MNIPDYPQEGQPLKAQFGRQVVDCIRALRIRAGRGLRKVAEDSSGTLLEAVTQVPAIAGESWAYKKPFDIEVAGAELTIVANLPSVNHPVAVSYRGVPKHPTAGSGLAWDASAQAWTGTLAAAAYVYLRFSRASGGVSIEMASAPTFTTPDDFEYHYLWFIAWAETAIDTANCVDLRDMVRVEGIS